LINDCRIIVYGGGQGTQYYDIVFIFDTTTCRWSKPTIKATSHLLGAHIRPCCIKERLGVFSGGNGVQALNGVRTLNLGIGDGDMSGGRGHDHGNSHPEGDDEGDEDRYEGESDKSKSERIPYGQRDWRYDGDYWRQ
jgi:hypothetical protein